MKNYKVFNKAFINTIYLITKDEELTDNLTTINKLFDRKIECLAFLHNAQIQSNGKEILYYSQQANSHDSYINSLLNELFSSDKISEKYKNSIMNLYNGALRTSTSYLNSLDGKHVKKRK